MKTFLEVAEYARARAVNSSLRNDPQAWAYWLEVHHWAAGTSEFPEVQGEEGDRRVAASLLELFRGELQGEPGRLTPRAAADLYSRIKWCARILRAHGVKVRLELGWMRDLRWGLPRVERRGAAS